MNLSYAGVQKARPIVAPRDNRPPPQYLHECLLMTPGGTLFWRDRPRAHFKNRRGYELFSEFVGCVATHRTPRGYLELIITFDGVRHTLRAHRVVWAMTSSAWPVGEIDHINRCKFDNRPLNLRDVTRAENMQNRAPGRSGYQGVSQLAPHRFRAHIRHEGRRTYLGCFPTADQAFAVFQAAREDLKK